MCTCIQTASHSGSKHVFFCFFFCVGIIIYWFNLSACSKCVCIILPFCLHARENVYLFIINNQQINIWFDGAQCLPHILLDFCWILDKTGLLKKKIQTYGNDLGKSSGSPPPPFYAVGSAYTNNGADAVMKKQQLQLIVDLVFMPRHLFFSAFQFIFIFNIWNMTKIRNDCKIIITAISLDISL